MNKLTFYIDSPVPYIGKINLMVSDRDNTILGIEPSYFVNSEAPEDKKELMAEKLNLVIKGLTVSNPLVERRVSLLFNAQIKCFEKEFLLSDLLTLKNKLKHCHLKGTRHGFEPALSELDKREVLSRIFSVTETLIKVEFLLKDKYKFP
jgi:hypothetical protein